MSTDNCNLAVGSIIAKGNEIKSKQGFVFKTRILKIEKKWREQYIQDRIDVQANIDTSKSLNNDKLEVKRTDLYKLGIIESENVQDKDVYPVLKGKGMVNEGVALVEMISRKFKLPMRKELCKKFLEQQNNRGKNLSLENIGGLCETIGCLTQIGVIVPEHLPSVDFPAIEINEKWACVHWAYKNGNLISSDPLKGLVKTKLEDRNGEESVRLLILKKSPNAESKQFGWSWFIPLIIKYKWALILVFAATMVAQLMNLAIPLLLQQIIEGIESR